MHESDISDRWHIGGRYYAVTVASDVATRDGIGLELDDVAPAPGRGLVLEVFRDDAADQQLLFTALSGDPLPLELVEQFLEEAREALLG